MKAARREECGNRCTILLVERLEGQCSTRNRRIMLFAQGKRKSILLLADFQNNMILRQ